MDRLKCALGLYLLCAHGRIACFHMKNVRWRKMQSFSMRFPFSAHTHTTFSTLFHNKLFHSNVPATHAHNCLLNDLKKIALYLHSPWFWVPKQNWFQYGRSINHLNEFFFFKMKFFEKTAAVWTKIIDNHIWIALSYSCRETFSFRQNPQFTKMTCLHT